MQSVDPAATETKGREEAPPKAAGGARSAALVTAGIVLSRLVGLVRQRVMAHYFGTSAWADMIAAAFRVGNITQNLMGEGTLSATFIPLYARLRGEGKGEEAARFARSALGLLLVVVVAASALGVLLAPWLSWLVAAGFDEEKLAGTATIVRIVFPMTGLLVLSAWGLGVLNAHRRFFLPYAAPVVWSLAQIAALVVAGTFLGQRGGALATALAWGAFAGAFLQLVVLLPAARRLLGGIAPRFDAKDPHVREAAARLPGALVGRGIIQISGLVDTLLVSFLGTGANATFGYAQTIYLLPMSVLGTGEAAAALPEFSRDTAETDVEKRNAAVRARLGASLARIAVLTVPATLVFVLLGGDLVALLLQTGTFDQEATARVKPLLAAYGFALLGNAAGRVLTTTAYALGDTRTPARFAVLRVVVSTALALVLMRPLGVLGVVLGAVIAGWVETCAMGIRLSRAIGGLGLGAIRAGRIALLAALSVGAGVLVRSILPTGLAGTTLGAMLSLGAFGAAFVVLCPLLGLFDLRSLLRRARR
ncbi:murein biosynthesis integral membrane protein MurJ [Polyangium sp. 15x6]|uniref:murein biosynthesis integral membrane protein MurJ n=1 Tax=Polyangium sp. 15x6 TaxID=3042687 RepID=UPI00249CB753|nr:murein biosynthesis integral membrane protein MurJ [Polyangium sp. 15x6]MDI3291034.1 murein biosynthesis integral membrane protein MurJ [Polyangium sp. 15x6]